MRAERSTFAFAHKRLAAVVEGRYALGDFAGPSSHTSVQSELADLLQNALGSDYRLERELEAGGMSRLFLAKQVRLDRDVVVKVLPPELVSTQSTARFKREIELTVRLQHPHILPILTSGAIDDVLYYITPHIPGESLRTRLAREKKLPLDDILRILKDVCGALAFAHQRSIVHRDVKPGNILLTEGHAILADFGIARAVSTTATALTESGVAPGTPAYMAPELPTDEKADVYALGVVAYEMLTGTASSAGVNSKGIIAARGKVAGDSRHRVRAISVVVAKAITRQPEQRLQSAREFLVGIERAMNQRGTSRRLSAAGMIGASLSVILGLFAVHGRPPSMQPDRYVVVPVNSTDSLSIALSRHIAEGLEEWIGPSVVDPTEVVARVKSNPPGPVRFNQALDIARSLRCSGLVTVEAHREADSIVARVTIYDPSANVSLRSRRVALSNASGPDVRQLFTRLLANMILRDNEQLPWKNNRETQRPSLVAWREYDKGRTALRSWRLSSAADRFRAAVRTDPNLSLAQVWLAQTIAWNPTSTSAELTSASRRAADLRNGLMANDSLRAVAISALAESKFLAACDAFRQLVAADSSDLSGWIGLGDCRAQDRLVISDSRTSTGWRFESSFEAAARAYQRAGEIGSAAVESEFQGWLLGRLSSVLYPITNRVRLGYSARGDTIAYGGLPYLDHDTLAFAPYSLAELAAGTHDPPPARVQDAVTRNRDILQRVAEDWVRRSPNNAAAYDSLAGWMEVSNRNAVIGQREVSTLDVVRRARSLSRDTAQLLRLSIADVRLLLKEGRLAEARSEADSILRRIPTRGEVAQGVPGLAALLGHVEEAAALYSRVPNERLIRVRGGQAIGVAPQVAASAARLLVYAAFNTESDSVRRIAARTLALIDSYYSDSLMAAEVRATLVGTALSLSYPAGMEFLKQLSVYPDETGRAFGMLARGDTSGARQQLVFTTRINAGRQTGTAIDRNLRRARLALMLGDTASAIQELDPPLRALPTLGPYLFDQVPQVVSLVRALALRAELASQTGDRVTAVQCASSVLTLWSRADASIQPTLVQMRTVAGKKIT